MRRTTRTPGTPLRRGVGLVLAVVQFVVSVGLPVPTPAGASDGPSACRGGRCGCSARERSRGTCCCAKPAPEPNGEGCCSKRAAAKSCCSAKPVAAEPVEPASFIWGLGWEAAKCRGDGPAGLFTTPPTVPPADPVRVVYELSPAGVIPAFAIVLTSVPSRPPTPPPKPA